MPKRKATSSLKKYKRKTKRIKRSSSKVGGYLGGAGGAALGGYLGGPPGAMIGRQAGTLIGSKAAGYAAKAYRNYRLSRKTKVYRADSTGLQSKNLGLIVMNRKPAKVARALGTYQYENVNQWVMGGTQGLQNVDYAEILFTYNQLTGVSTSGNRNERATWHDNPFTLNPYYARPTSALYPNAISAVSRIDVLYIKKVDWITEIVSMSKLPQEVVLHFLTPVFDTNVGPIEAWSNVLAAKSEGQNAQVVAGSIATAAAGAGSATINDVGSSPFHHKEFRNSWKSVKTIKMILQAGEQINFRMTIMYEKVVSKETLTNNRNTTYLAGLSVYPMFISKCGLEGLSSGTGVESTEVSYGRPKIGVVLRQHMLFGALPQSRISTARTYQGQVVATANTERIIDDDDQIQENPAEE